MLATMTESLLESSTSTSGLGRGCFALSLGCFVCIAFCEFCKLVRSHTSSSGPYCDIQRVPQNLAGSCTTHSAYCMYNCSSTWVVRATVRVGPSHGALSTNVTGMPCNAAGLLYWPYYPSFGSLTFQVQMQDLGATANVNRPIIADHDYFVFEPSVDLFFCFSCH